MFSAEHAAVSVTVRGETHSRSGCIGLPQILQRRVILEFIAVNRSLGLSNGSVATPDTADYR